MADTSAIQTLARAYLNDADVAAGDVFLDAVLLPFVQSAYRDLQRRLAENGVSVLIFETDLDLATNVTVIDSGSTPALPTGFIVPHSLREKPTSGSNKFQAMAKHVNGMPDIDPVDFLRIWEWRQGGIQMIGANTLVTVKVRYEKQLTDLTQSGNDATIQINGAEEALALRTALFAARSRGSRAGSSDLMQEYLSEVVRMVRRNRKPEQRRSRRRKPYGWRNNGAQRY